MLPHPTPTMPVIIDYAPSDFEPGVRYNLCNNLSESKPLNYVLRFVRTDPPKAHDPLTGNQYVFHNETRDSQEKIGSILAEQMTDLNNFHMRSGWTITRVNPPPNKDMNRMLMMLKHLASPFNC
jgi:hypothetical protein